MTIRRAHADDAPAISAIQAASAEAAQWDPAGYGIWVAELDEAVVGFLVIHSVLSDESEILNVAVHPATRRKGVARALITSVLKQHRGAVYLEVRESNIAARNLYQQLGFKEVARRPAYYDHPPEGGIVMKFHSC